MQLHVAGTLKLLIDYLVHPAAGIDQAGGDNREAASFLNVTRRAKELFGRIEGYRVNAAGKGSATGRHCQVVGSSQPGHTVQQNDHILFRFHQALGPLQSQLGHPALLLHRFVECRREHIPLHRAAHVSNLFGALTDEHHHQHRLGQIFGDTVGQVLENGGLAGFGRGDYQSSLSQSDGGKEVYHPGGQVGGLGLQDNSLFREDGGQVFELGAGTTGNLLWIESINPFHPNQTEIALSLLWRAHLPGDRVSRLEPEAPDLRLGNINVSSSVRVGHLPQEAITLIHYLQNAGGNESLLGRSRLQNTAQ